VTAKTTKKSAMPRFVIQSSPVDDPLVAVADRAGAHAAGIGAGLDLGERESRRPLAARELRQVALLQLLGPEQLDRERAELLHHQHQSGRRARLRQFLHRDVERQRARPGAAVLLVEREREDVLLGQQLPQVVRVLGLLVDLGSPRGNPLAGDLADQVAERDLLLAEGVDVGCRLLGDSLIMQMWSWSPRTASRGRFPPAKWRMPYLRDCARAGSTRGDAHRRRRRGTMDALVATLGGELHKRTVSDPLAVR